jgi:hypothetical protein
MAELVVATAAHIGGYRAMAVTSSRHAAQLLFQRLSRPSADYFRPAGEVMQAAGERI